MAAQFASHPLPKKNLLRVCRERVIKNGALDNIRSSAQSGAISCEGVVRMSMRSTAMSLWLVGSLASQPAAGHAQAVRTSPVTVRGIVTDDGNAPIASVELMLAPRGERGRLFRTGSDGTFSFEDVSPGTVSLTARRLGYLPRTLKLEINGTVPPDPVSLVLQTVVTAVAPVLVEGTDRRLDTFYAHKRQSSFGRFIDAADIARRGPVYLSEIFRTIAGATVRPSGGAGNVIRLRGCKPMLWMDGIRVPNAELDDIANPMDVGGMEVYTSWSALPGEYMDRESAGCGAIVIWTKGR